MTQERKKSGEEGHPDFFAGQATRKRDWEGLAEIYGKSVRTLKRYDQNGRACGDPPVLEDPVKTRDWWQRHMKQQVPAWLMRASAATMPSAPPIRKAVAMPPANEDEEHFSEMEVSEDEIGLEKTLERLAKTEVKLSRKATEPGQTQAWLNTIARISTVAEKLRMEQERRRELIPRTEAEKMIHEFHAPIERETRQLARTMCEVTGLPFTPHVQEAWNKECDRLFARLQEEVFR